MEENKDRMLKPKSFRINDETAEKIKEISNNIGGNQQETISKLIEAYEFQAGKAILTEKKADIEKFEQYVTTITRMFMTSLEDNQNLAETIRAEFDALLKSKDETIQDLQKQAGEAKAARDEAVSKAQRFEEENEVLKAHTVQLDNEYASKVSDLQSMVSDKEKMNQTLSELWADVKRRLNNAEAELEEYETVKDELAKTKTAYEEEIKRKEQEEAARTRAEANLEELRTKYEEQKEQLIKQWEERSAAEKERALFEVEKKYEQRLQTIISEKQSEIDKYQHKYMELLEKISKEKTKS